MAELKSQLFEYVKPLHKTLVKLPIILLFSYAHAYAFDLPEELDKVGDGSVADDAMGLVRSS